MVEAACLEEDECGYMRQIIEDEVILLPIITHFNSLPETQGMRRN